MRNSSTSPAASGASAGTGRKVALDEASLSDLMQALNGVRLVLGTLLDVHEDDDPDEAELTPEYGLYAYLSWMLYGCVAAASDISMPTMFFM